MLALTLAAFLVSIAAAYCLGFLAGERHAWRLTRAGIVSDPHEKRRLTDAVNEHLRMVRDCEHDFEGSAFCVLCGSDGKPIPPENIVTRQGWFGEKQVRPRR